MKRLLLLLCLTLFSASRLFARDVDVVGSEWKMERIWKSAHESGGAKYHFYKGELTLQNVGEAEITNVCARITLLDPGGRKINSSTRMSFGTIAKGKKIKENFTIDKAVQFGELTLNVTYELNGDEKAAKFSSADLSPPTSVDIDKTGARNEIRVLSDELDQPLTGKNKGKTYLVIRVRNLSTSPASNVTAKVTIDTSKYKEKKKSKSRRKRKKDEDEVQEVKVVKGKVVVDILLDEEPIPPGEVRSYRKRIKGIKEYNGYSVKLSAEWPDRVIETPGEVIEGPKYQVLDVDGGKLKFGNMKIIKDDTGKSIIYIDVINGGVDIAADRFNIDLQFFDATGKEVKRIKHVCKEAFPKNKSILAEIAGQDIPEYSTYSIGVSW